MEIFKTKFLIIVSILLLLSTGIFIQNSRIIWIINPPKSDPVYSHFTIQLSLYSTNYPYSPLYNLDINILRNATVYSPNKILIFNVSIVSNDIPSIPMFINNNQTNMTLSNTVLSFYIGVYFYFFHFINQTYRPLIQTENKTFLLDSNQTTKYNLIWNSETVHNLMSSGESKENYGYEFAISIQTQYKNNSNNEIYDQSLIEVFGNTINYYRNETNQLIVLGSQGLTKTQVVFTFVNWGILDQTIIAGLVLVIAIVIPLIPFISNFKKKLLIT